MAGDLLHTVGEGEKGVRTDDGSLERQQGLRCSDTGRIHTAHLAGPDADGLTGPSINNGVRLDVLNDFPGKFEGLPLVISRWALGDDLPFFILRGWVV